MVVKWLREHVTASWLMMVFLLYLGYEWVMAGWGKITQGFDATGFLKGALAKAAGEHPAVQSWWAGFIENVALPNVGLFNFLVPWGEFLVGIALILGLFTTFAALMGAVMNFALCSQARRARTRKWCCSPSSSSSPEPMRDDTAWIIGCCHISAAGGRIKRIVHTDRRQRINDRHQAACAASGFLLFRTAAPSPTWKGAAVCRVGENSLAVRERKLTNDGEMICIWMKQET